MRGVPLGPWELLQAKGYIWPSIPPLVLIRIQYCPLEKAIPVRIEIKLFNISLERGVYYTVHSLESIWTYCQWEQWGKHQPYDCYYARMSVLGQEEGYTLKNNHLLEGVPQDKARGYYWTQRVYITVYLSNTIYLPKQ